MKISSRTRRSKLSKPFENSLKSGIRSAFLRKIVCDTVRDHWRRRRPVEDLNAIRRDDSLRSPPASKNGSTCSVASPCCAWVWLSSTQRKRTTLDLFYVEECPVSEIARLQKKSVSAVKMELLRARRLAGENSPGIWRIRQGGPSGAAQ